ncbi:MAG: hypothetical protein QJR07_06825 [Acetobacteraceae bacterium]|nr:hypothetical protein [Acetobacteraceae bacterium]
MHRQLALASVLVTGAACSQFDTTQQAAAPATPRPPAAASAQAAGMQPGQRMMIGPMEGRVIRNVMISQGGGGIDVVYDMPPGAPESRRVLRLENVNGMLEVVYDTEMPSSQPLASGGTPRLVPEGGGMYRVVYDRQGGRR